MRVLLLNAAFNRYGGVQGHGGAQIPLNLCYLAAYVRRQRPGVEVRILDAEAEGLRHEQTVERAAGFAPDLVGITANTCVFDSVIDLTALLKRRMPSAKVVLGGSHPTALPERTLAECQADFLVLGEGEITLNELAGRLAEGPNGWGDIAGLAFRDAEGKAVVNAPRPLIEDLDSLPMPARDLVDNSLYYPPPTKNVSSGRSTLISTSRGCPFHCGFCSANTVWMSRRIRSRSAGNLVEEMAECVGRYGIASFNFADEFFTADKARVLAICELIRQRGLEVTWVCSARAQKLDRQTLQAMKAAGCRELSFGIESGSPEILQRMDKRIDLEEAKSVISAANALGIRTHAGFIIGYPGETAETVRQTVRVAKWLDVDIAAFWIASPLPGSRLWEEANANGWIRPGARWSDFSPLSNNRSVLTIPTLSIDRIRQLHRRALRSFYFRPRYILRKLLSIRHGYQIANLFKGLLILMRIRK
ncbi:MAG TPA: radical SAM protein [Phycisphaerae bacterium]|nr:radical SAM protein [Phycisphaerae bacterium]